jgi:hypothetical protein
LGEALVITNYLQNQSPTKVVTNNITPYEIWFCHKPILSHLQIFGCKAYAFIDKNKLDFHTIECIFLGYLEESKAYQLMKHEKYGIFIFRDVIIYENPIKVINSIIEENDPNPLLDVNFFQINITSPQTSTIAGATTNKQPLTLNLVQQAPSLTTQILTHLPLDSNFPLPNETLETFLEFSIDENHLPQEAIYSHSINQPPNPSSSHIRPKRTMKVPTR